jgi:hypothetical protein
MISIPLDLSRAPQNTIRHMFTDDLGEPDDLQWQMYAYDPASPGYVQVPNESTRAFEQGQAYWLITRDAVTPDTGPAEGLSTSTDTSFTLELKPGWNMIGDPFNFAVEWGSILVDGHSVLVDSLVEEPHYWNYSGPTPVYDSLVSVLYPFEGY